jgi:hypothetical protein
MDYSRAKLLKRLERSRRAHQLCGCENDPCGAANQFCCSCRRSAWAPGPAISVGVGVGVGVGDQRRRSASAFSISIGVGDQRRRSASAFSISIGVGDQHQHQHQHQRRRSASASASGTQHSAFSLSQSASASAFKQFSIRVGISSIDASSSPPGASSLRGGAALRPSAHDLAPSADAFGRRARWPRRRGLGANARLGAGACHGS